MKITIEELPASRIAYFRNVGEYGEKQNKKLMESFKDWVSSKGFPKNSTILGIPQDNPQITPIEKCRYDVCVVVDKGFNVEKPAHAGLFSGGKYAVFTLDHTKETISEFWNNIYSEIASNNLSIREQPIIERYTTEMLSNHLCEILIPIQ